ncbi:MAG: hypothetical protein O9272_16660 [Brevundimonas sp.]|jgi:hypothetical protein|nr:hypothetical protein [Brevundimonas sp.]
MEATASPGLGFVEFVQNSSWVIPVVQSIHILCIGAVFATIGLVNLRRIGMFAGDVEMPDFDGRRLKAGWGILVLLAATGLIMIASEPERTLSNTLFYVKLGLLALACLLTFPPLQSGSEIATKARALVALIAWVLIIFAGRWIAYVI